MRHTIEVFRDGDAYTARLHAPAVVAALGQGELPTAFTGEADPLDVVREIQRLNPEADVVLVPAPADVRPAASERTSFRNHPSMN